MRIRSIRAAFLLAVPCALLSCSTRDDPAGPDPTPTSPPTIEEFFASTSNPLNHGDSTRLVWSAPNATTTAISPNVGTVGPADDGSVLVRPSKSTTYTLTASNTAGSATAQFTIEVEYLPGFYVSRTTGDDANDGLTPLAPLETIGEAVTRAGGGAAVFVAGGSTIAAGTYDERVELNSVDVSIYAGRNPATFFAEPKAYPTTIRTTGASPLVVRNTATRLEFVSLTFDAASTGAEAARIENAGANFEGCTFDASESTSGTAIVLVGSSFVTVNASRVLGGRGPSFFETAGIRASSGSDLLLTNCFIDGGRAIDRSSGVEARGIVRLGFNTILAEVAASGVGRLASAVRILEGHPTLGGNIFIGSGAAQRVGVEESVAGVNPAWFEGNLFLSMSQPPYLNADGDSPLDPEDLEGNEAYLFTTGDASTVGGNYWPTTISGPSLFADFGAGDFHLVDPLPGGGANPAVNRGDTYLADPRYGSVTRDFDLERRPTVGASLDLGADEK